jgi:hypothetical protein
MNETDKRIKLLVNLFDNFDKTTFESIMLVGSLSYGKYYSITKNSDIDLLFILDKKNIKEFLRQKFFTTADYFHQEKIELLKEERVDGFWIDQHVEDVMINMGIYRSDSFENFCMLRKRKWKMPMGDISISRKWDKARKYKGTDGKIYQNLGSYKKNKELYVKSYNVYTKGAFISNVFASNLLTAEILYDKKRFASRSVGSFKKSLVKRYGRESTLNILDYIFQKTTDKRNAEIIKNI